MASPSALRVGLALLAILPCAARLGAQPQGYVIEVLDGSEPSAAFGFAVAVPGDLDGDGTPDLVVGSPGGDPGGLVDAGRVLVFSRETGLLLFVLNGSAAGDRYGISLASLGDLDGDGVSDFAAGATQGGSGGAGYLRAVSGATGNLLFSVAGASPSDAFGVSVAGLGDVDGDSVPDLVVGASQSTEPNGFASGPGYAEVRSGSSGNLVLSFAGTGVGDDFGRSVASAGDMNGDGVPDILVGAPQGMTTPLQPGYVRVLSGAGGATILTLTGSAPTDGFGRSVLGLDDSTGDGMPEILVRASGFLDYVSLLWIGYAQARSGSTGAALYTVPTQSGPFLPVARVSDADGDGIADFLMGGSWPAETLRSAATGSTIATFGSLGCSSLAEAGDANADGVADYWVGAGPGLAFGPWQAGTVYAVSTAGIPPGSARFGTGCAGSGGFVPGIEAVGGNPNVVTGNSYFGAYLYGALGGTTALLLVGSSSQSWVGLNLPIPLGLLGMPACSLLVSPDVAIPAPVAGAGPGTGSAVVNLAVPVMPTLYGSLVFLQWYVVDPGPLPLPGAMSRGFQLFLLP